MRFCISTLLVLLVIYGSSQGGLAQSSGTEDSTKLSGTLSNSAKKIADSDSLIVRRSLLAAFIYKNGVRLPRKSVMQDLRPMPKSVTQFRWARLLKPVGPLVALSGLAVGYVGIKGVPASAVIRGKRTAATPNPPTEQVNYTIRSLPELVAGVGLFVGGLCLVELSHELMTKAVKPYNKEVGMRQKTTFLHATKFGFTPSGNLGFYARF